MNPDNYEKIADEVILTQPELYDMWSPISTMKYSMVRQDQYVHEYLPRMCRHQFQIGLWKVNHQHVGRIKGKFGISLFRVDMYFTPKTTKFTQSEDFTSFAIETSLDGKHIMLISNNIINEKKLVVIFETKTLLYVTELEVRVEDEEYTAEGVEENFLQGNDDAFGTLACSFPTVKYFPKMILWDDGKRLMSAVSKFGAIVHYYYAVYDTETGEEINKVMREDSELGKNLIYCVQQDTNNSKTINLLMNRESVIKVINLDPSSGNMNTVSTQELVQEGFKVYNMDLGETSNKFLLTLKTTGGYRVEKKRIVVTVKNGEVIKLNKEQLKQKNYDFRGPTVIVGEKFYKIDVFNIKVA